MQPQCLIRWQQKCRQFNSDSTRTPKLGWGFVQVALRIGDVIPRGAAVAPIKCAAWGCGTSGSCAVKMLAPWHRNLISHQNTRPNSIYFDFCRQAFKTFNSAVSPSIIKLWNSEPWIDYGKLWKCGQKSCSSFCHNSVFPSFNSAEG